MIKLFEPLKIRDVEFRNRIFVSPMCQYSSDEGMPTDWHMVHLGSRAVGGAAAVIIEATGVSPEGRISPWDSGLWSGAHAQAFVPINRFMKEHGAVPGVQLAHAGRKASTYQPWAGGGLVPVGSGGWQPIGPSAIAFDSNYAMPRAMSFADIEAAVLQFVTATRLSVLAGFELIELHMAHGYLMHEFLSPLSNQRTDQYGGSLENRMRLPLRITAAVREAWPSGLPLFVRISATDWADGGWDLPQSIELCKRLKEIGVDLIDCSSGGQVPGAKIPLGPGYQVPFAEAIRKQAGIATGAVGMITEAHQAEKYWSMKRPMWCCSRGSCCEIHTGPCTRQKSWVPILHGQNSTAARNRQDIQISNSAVPIVACRPSPGRRAATRPGSDSIHKKGSSKIPRISASDQQRIKKEIKAADSNAEYQAPGCRRDSRNHSHVRTNVRM